MRLERVPLFFVMPWTTDNPPPPAKNWPAEDQQKCISAANAVLSDGGSEKQAIFACIRAAGRSEQSSMNEGQFFIPTEDAAENVLIFPIGKFYRDGVEREFTPDDAVLMADNFNRNIIGRLPPINREHKRELGKIGHITRLYAAPDGVRGDTDGDLSGFDFISPEVRWTWTHPKTGQEHRNVLMGAGATNYPFFLGEMALNSDALLWTGSEWEEYDSMPDDNVWDRIKDRVNELVSQRLDEQAVEEEEQEDDGGKEMAKEQPEVEVKESPQEELATEPTATEDYAERIATLEAQLESFTAKLESEKEARSKVEEAFAESERQRRLMHFSDVVRTFAVGTDEPEKFAEDLLAVEQASPELADRMITRWRAASEAVKQAGVFEQFSQPEKGDPAGDPFLTLVEKTRQEQFSELSPAEGWVKAEKLVASQNKNLARDYAERTRGGQ